MKTDQYLEQYVTIANNHITVEKIESDGPYCATCWQQDKELVKAPFDSRTNGWVCKKGHVGKNDGLASGTTVRTNFP